MRRALALVFSLSMLLAACGDDSGGATTTTVPIASSGSIHLSGGLEGREETWRIEPDGTVFGPDGYTGALDAAERAAFEAAITGSGFFDLDEEYLPDDLCCDRFLYEVTITRGGVTHTVTTIDAADAPEALFTLIQTFLEVVRPA